MDKGRRNARSRSGGQDGLWSQHVPSRPRQSGIDWLSEGKRLGAMRSRGPPDNLGRNMKQVSVETIFGTGTHHPCLSTLGREIATSGQHPWYEVERNLQPEPERLLQGGEATTAVSGRGGRAPLRFVEHDTDPRRRGTVCPGRNALVLASPDAIREHWGRASFLLGLSSRVECVDGKRAQKLHGRASRLPCSSPCSVCGYMLPRGWLETGTQ